jgi:hypothetical protein
MPYWPFWLGGFLLAAVMVGHWLLLRRMMAVSGRVSALVDRMRFGQVDEPELSNDEIMAALKEATLQEFGEGSLDGSAPAPDAKDLPPPRRRLPLSMHFVFFASLVAGGFAAGQWTGRFSVGWDLRGSLFDSFFGESPVVGGMILLVGGILIGAGTRMAGGCTTGHGLCGMGRLQSGSALATVAFFGAGVVTSLLLGVLL